MDHHADALNVAAQSHIRSHVKEHHPEHLKDLLGVFNLHKSNPAVVPCKGRLGRQWKLPRTITTASLTKRRSIIVVYYLY